MSAGPLEQLEIQAAGERAKERIARNRQEVVLPPPRPATRRAAGFAPRGPGTAEAMTTYFIIIIFMVSVAPFDLT